VYLERAESVIVRYRDETGQPARIEASGGFSELLQHEIDHLDGVLAIDRAIDANSFCMREEYERRFSLKNQIFATGDGVGAS
jgi:peptide deformylase